GSGVEQHGGRIEPVKCPARPVHAPPEAEVGGQSFEADVPMIAGAVSKRMQFDFGDRPVGVDGLEDELDGRAVFAKEGEIDAVADQGRAERQGPTTKHAGGHVCRLAGGPWSGEARRGGGSGGVGGVTTFFGFFFSRRGKRLQYLMWVFSQTNSTLTNPCPPP